MPHLLKDKPAQLYRSHVDRSPPLPTAQEAAPACLQLLIEEMWRRRPGITVRAAEAYRGVPYDVLSLSPILLAPARPMILSLPRILLAAVFP